MAATIKAIHNYLLSIEPESLWIPFLSVIPVISNLFLLLRERDCEKNLSKEKFALIAKRVVKWSVLQFLWVPFVVIPALAEISFYQRMFQLGCLAFSAVLIEEHFNHCTK